MKAHQAVTGVILAGGKGSRMDGKDKGLQLLKDKPLWEYVAKALQLQTHSLAISANRSLEIYRASGIPVYADLFDGYPGPLAGMLSVIKQSDSAWYLFCPCDTPFIPADLARRLWENRGNAPAVWVHDGDRDHPAISLIKRCIADELEVYLNSGERRVMDFLHQCGGHHVDFTDVKASFININTAADLLQMQEKA